MDNRNNVREMLQRLPLLGINDLTPVFERRNISVINLLSSAFFLFFFLYEAILLAYFERSLIPILLCSIVYQLGLLVTLGLHRLGKIVFARHFFIAHTFLLVTLMSLLLGRDSMFHFYLLSCFFTCFYIFPRAQSRLSYIWCLCFFLTFCLIELWRANPFIVHTGNPDFLPAIRTFTIMAGLTSVIFIKAAISTHMLNINEAKIEEEQQKVGRLFQMIKAEQEKSDTLLLNLLPERIVNRLKSGEKTIADSHGEVTILFADLVGFTKLAKIISPAHLIEVLDKIFSKFDTIVDDLKLEKVKTIGDCYMVSDAISHNTPNAEAVAECALQMMEAVRQLSTEDGIQIEVRIGISTGHAISGVLGRKTPHLDIWGETVNLASRMESSGMPGQIQVAESTYWRLHNKYRFENPKEIDVKGFGPVKTYSLGGKL